MNEKHPPIKRMTIPFDAFEPSMMSNDLKSYFIDGFGSLEMIEANEEGVVVDYYDYCDPEWNAS